MTNSIYDFTVTTNDGQIIKLSDLKGKVILIVNTASRCGFTPQYIELEYLYRKYKNQGLIILAFPCNQFANQEPKNDQQIADFCKNFYDISFPIMQKTLVNGSQANPLFKFLKQKAPGILGSINIKWNFTKFLINHDSSVIVRYSPITKPKVFEVGIQSLLAEINQ